MAEVESGVAQRLIQLFEHLDFRRAHLAGAINLDFQELLMLHPNVVASLTLVSPNLVDPVALRAISQRLLVTTAMLAGPRRRLAGAWSVFRGLPTGFLMGTGMSSGATPWAIERTR